MPYFIHLNSAVIPFTTGDNDTNPCKKVFRLPDRLTCRVFPFHLSGTV